MFHGEHSAILLTFIKLPLVIKIFVLSIFEWPFYTGFTVYFFLPLENVFALANSAEPDDIPQHFIWVFSVCYFWFRVNKV